jgi:hypothetical protein
LQHLLVAVGIAECENGATSDEAVVPTGLPGPSSTNSSLASFVSSGLPLVPTWNFTIPDEPTTCSGGMP